MVINEIKKRQAGASVEQSPETLPKDDDVLSPQKARADTRHHHTVPRKRQRSTFVTVVAWICIVLAGCTTGISLLQNLMLHLMFPVGEFTASVQSSDVHPQLPAIHRFIFSHIQLVFLSFFGLSGGLLISAIGLLKRKNWARLMFITFLIVGILLNVAGLLVAQFSIFTSMPTAPTESGYGQFQTVMMVMKIFSLLMSIGLSVLFG